MGRSSPTQGNSSPKRGRTLRTEPRWLPVDIVVEINRQEVADGGEPFAVLNPDILKSAVMKAWNLWHYDNVEDVVTLASALLFGIACNQPFERGNRRTGLTAAVVFLRLNGYVLDAPDSDEFAEAIVAVTSGRISERDFVEAVSRNAVRPFQECGN